MNAETGYVSAGDAHLYYEVGGDGPPLVFIHAGVADSRQWNNEFAAFATDFRVIRYDMRGYGRSEPVPGDYRPIDDLQAVLDALNVNESIVLVGCSMGGGIAMDYTLTYPDRVRAVVMVGSAPGGLWLDVDFHPLEDAVAAAQEAGDLERVAELETQMFFDGIGRRPEEVDPEMRQLALEMNRIALNHAARDLGKRLPNVATSAAERLGELSLPILVLTGDHDEPYIQAAAAHMVEHIANARHVPFADAAHLLNMDQPARFEQTLRHFLKALP